MQVSILNLKSLTNVAWEDTLNKFHCFNLTEYDKVFFLDADIILFENLDYLFDKIEFISKSAIYFPPKNFLNNAFAASLLRIAFVFSSSARSSLTAFA